MRATASQRIGQEENSSTWSVVGSKTTQKWIPEGRRPSKPSPGHPGAPGRGRGGVRAGALRWPPPRSARLFGPLIPLACG